MLSKLKVLMIYALLGPSIGGLSTFMVFTATDVLPELFQDPENVFGRNRVSEYLSSLILSIIFSYPYGLAPALISGATHTATLKRFQAQRFNCIAWVCVTGATATGIEVLLTKDLSALILLSSLASAAIVSWCLSRPSGQKI